MKTMSYPFEITPSGKVAEAEGVTAMLQQVKLTLATTLGSRVMRPEFGSNLPSQVFEAMDVTSGEEFREDVTRAVHRSVAGARVEQVEVDFDEDRGGMSVTVYVSREQEVDPRTFTVSLAFGRVVEDLIP